MRFQLQSLRRLGFNTQFTDNSGMKRILILTLLAGCAAQEQPLPPQREDTCGAARFADLIGQNATALEKTLLLGPVRVIRPGDAVTMDFRPTRINFKISENDTIRTIDCG